MGIIHGDLLASLQEYIQKIIVLGIHGNISIAGFQQITWKKTAVSAEQKHPRLKQPVLRVRIGIALFIGCANVTSCWI